MTTSNKDILKIADQACLNIVFDERSLVIKNKFRLADKSNFGIILFLFGGLFLLIFPFIKTSDIVTKIIGIVIGLFLSGFAIITLIRQVSDGLQIKGNILSFRLNLKERRITLSGQLKLTMKEELIKLRRSGTMGSDFIVITHFLEDKNETFPILTFQMESSNKENAKKLGNELTTIISSKIQADYCTST